MAENLPKPVLDEVTNAISKRDLTIALYLCYQVCGQNLDLAWSALLQVMQDLGTSEGELPERDPYFSPYNEVRRYLTRDRWTRWKQLLPNAALTVLLLGGGAWLLSKHGTALTRSLGSLTWPGAEATIVDVRHYTKRNFTTRQRTTSNYMALLFQYDVEEQSYQDSESGIPAFRIIGGDHFFEPGDQITIAYNPRDPADAIYQRKIYHYGIRVVFSLPMLIFGALVVAYEWSQQQTLWKLQRLDRQHQN